MKIVVSTYSFQTFFLLKAISSNNTLKACSGEALPMSAEAQASLRALHKCVISVNYIISFLAFSSDVDIPSFQIQEKIFLLSWNYYFPVATIRHKPYVTYSNRVIVIDVDIDNYRRDGLVNFKRVIVPVTI